MAAQNNSSAHDIPARNPQISSSHNQSVSEKDDLKGPPSDSSKNNSVGNPQEPINDALARLDLAAFWQWAVCFCIANFDLELGQTLDVVYPPVPFSDAERRTIAFSAFPDSNSAEHVGDSCFTFRMRNPSFCESLYLRQKAPHLHAAHTHLHAAHTHLPPAPSVGLPVDTDGFIYGFVFFRQQQDPEVRRGYLQKSLVLMSPHPWPGLFLYIVSLLGPEIMKSLVADRRTTQKCGGNSQLAFQGMALLESACANIASWPSPPSPLLAETSYCSTTHAIPFLGRVQRISFPPNVKFPQLFDLAPSGTTSNISSRNSIADVVTAGTDLSPPLLCTPARLYQLFSRSIESLWTCWELMVMGEPILILADTPRACSDVVWSLIELIKPIPFGGDFRPYFTIQDSDFKAVKGRSGQPPQGLVLGTTNMVFQRIMSNWPHTIRVMRQSVVSPSVTVAAAAAAAAASINQQKNATRTFGPSFTPPNILSGHQGFTLGRGIGTINDLAAPSISATFTTTSEEDFGSTTTSLIDSIATKHRSYLSRDKRVIKDIIEASARGHSNNLLNNMVRRHFIELTERFLHPLNRYFDSLIVGNPTQMTLSNLRSKPEVKPFRQDTFLQQIEQTTPKLSLSAKRPLVDLYRAFLKSPNFARWLQIKTTEVARTWRQHYLDTLCFSPVQPWARARIMDHHDVECIDLLMRLRDELEKYSRFFVMHGDQIQYANIPGIPSPEFLEQYSYKTRLRNQHTSHTGSLRGTMSNPSTPSRHLNDTTQSVHLQASSSLPFKSVSPNAARHVRSSADLPCSSSASSSLSSSRASSPKDASPRPSLTRKPSTPQRRPSLIEFGIDITSLRVDSSNLVSPRIQKLAASSTISSDRNIMTPSPPPAMFRPPSAPVPGHEPSSSSSSSSVSSCSRNQLNTESPQPNTSGTSPAPSPAPSSELSMYTALETPGSKFSDSINTPIDRDALRQRYHSDRAPFGGTGSIDLGASAPIIASTKISSSSPDSFQNVPNTDANTTNQKSITVSTTPNHVSDITTTNSTSNSFTTTTTTTVSPTSLKSAGWFIPSCDHYTAMRNQFTSLLAVLPDDLRMSMSYQNVLAVKPQQKP